MINTNVFFDFTDVQVVKRVARVGPPICRRPFTRLPGRRHLHVQRLGLHRFSKPPLRPHAGGAGRGRRRRRGR